MSKFLYLPKSHKECLCFKTDPNYLDIRPPPPPPPPCQWHFVFIQSRMKNIPDFTFTYYAVYKELNQKDGDVQVTDKAN